MRRVEPRNVIFQAFYLVVLATIAFGFMVTAYAGIRGPGKYCGVVVFDRWDTCFLLSGPFITYISDKVKSDLRLYEGSAIEVDASDVFQPMNPGDALIRKFKVIGPAPDPHRWLTLDGLELIAHSDFDSSGAPAFLVEIRNKGDKPIEILSGEIGPTLLGSNQEIPFSASDGSSVAWITRGNLSNPSSWECTVDGVRYSASYTIDSESRLPERFELEPGQSRETRIAFELTPGQYEFIVGYGGGVHKEKSLASNAILFDVSAAGIATHAR
jgi:hypothetical protein